MKIVIILPTYNERINISKLIPLLEEEIFPRIKNHNIHILVVDDNSPDGTAEEVNVFKHKWKNISLLTGKKKGLGAAYVKGIHYAMDKMNAEAVMEFDADFQHDPKDIPNLINALDNGADYVIGSRYIPGGKIPKEWGIHRKFISRIGGLFAQIVFWRWDIHDLTSGFKLTKTSYLKKVDLEHLFSYYYAYKLHILHDILKLGAKVKEVPIVFYERREGSSKITGKDLFDSFFVVLRLRFNDSKRFIKFMIVGGTGFIVQLIVQEGSIRTGLMSLLAVGLVKPAAELGLSHNVKILADALGAGLGAEAAILSNFFFNNYWTFKDTGQVKDRLPFIQRLLSFNFTSFDSIIIQFGAVGIAEMLIGQRLIFFGLEAPVRIIILFPTIILLVIPMNYFIYNKLIWKTHRLKKEPNLI